MPLTVLLQVKEKDLCIFPLKLSDKSKCDLRVICAYSIPHTKEHKFCLGKLNRLLSIVFLIRVLIFFLFLTSWVSVSLFAFVMGAHIMTNKQQQPLHHHLNSASNL